jgi:putative spermidine/putrescine transport system substrate-binding protein
MEAGEPWYKDGKTNMVPQMPTAPQNTKNYFLVDPIFWADNGTELGEKWEAMKAGAEREANGTSFSWRDCCVLM